MLWLAAGRIEREYGGVVPKRTEELQTLEGIGPYTAAAIAAFAYNQPVIVVETNIRSVFISEFLGKEDAVKDSQLIPLIEVTLDQDNPRKWYNALMDYGADLKLKGSNPGRKSRHYTKQSAFVGSGREVRGKILKLLARGEKLTNGNMETVLPFELTRVEAVMSDLLKEGLVIKKRNGYYLP
jgi:A/G-specific adenine glycosylase